MPRSAWNAKRERQYEHIKDSEKKQGRSTKRAKEIAARTVNKERAQKGEIKGRASRTLRHGRWSLRRAPPRSSGAWWPGPLYGSRETENSSPSKRKIGSRRRPRAVAWTVLGRRSG